MEYYSASKNNEFMKFLGKRVELENVILSEATQSQKSTHGYALTDKWTLAQKLKINKSQFTDHRKLKKMEDQSGGALVPLRNGTKYSQEQLWRQSVEQRLKEEPPRSCPTWGFIL